MWQNRLNGVLGLWVMALAFLAFSVSLHRFLLIITGFAITLIAFWGNHLIKPTKDLVKESREATKRLNQFEILKPVSNIPDKENEPELEKEKPKESEVKKIVASLDDGGRE